jgi:endonuclease/exonuclease/phosphatase family metal-dependent hydrolase
MGKPRSLLAAMAALLLVSCGDPSGVPDAEFDPDVIIPVTTREDAGIAVTLATWNVEGLDLGGGEPGGTYDGVALALKNASVEVVALEEVQADDIPRLADALEGAGASLPYIASSSQSDGYNALAVASAYPLAEAVEILLPSTGSWPRSVYKVRIEVGKGLVLFVCHLKSGSDSSSTGKRIDQAAALGNYLRDAYGASLSSETLVVLGDMNTMSGGDRSGSPSTLALLELRDDASEANDFASMTEALLYPSDSYTWEGAVSGTWTRSSLDHLILSPGARARYLAGTLRVYRSDPSVSMTANSDHYPVVLDILL